MRTLFKNVDIRRCANATAAGVTTITGSIIDTQGYDGVAFVAVFGDRLDTSVVSLSAEQNTINSATGMAAVQGSASHTSNATSGDNKSVILDIGQPRERFIRPILARTVANSAVDAILALLYRASNAPITLSADVVASAFLAAPSE